MAVLFADREQVLIHRLWELLARVEPGLLDRSVLAPHQSYEDYFATMLRADVLLDTAYRGGGLTACDALACGKPMVT